MEREFKSFELIEIKADEATRTVEGLGSVFNNVDSYNDIVMPGAFAKSLKRRMPAMLWQHNADQPIGVWEAAEETEKGLLLKGTILDTTLGEDAYKLARAGAIKGLSIGYATKKYEIDQEKGTRRLQEVELFEVSLVTFPANEKAKITRVKSLEELQFDELFEHKRKIEAALRDAGASDRVATYVASLIPQPAQRDAGGEDHKELAELFGRFTQQLTL